MWRKYVILILSITCWATISFAKELPNCNIEMVVKWDFGVEEGNYPDATAFDVDGDNYPRGLAVDDKGYIYVGDGVHYELLKFAPTGSLVWKTQLQVGAKARPELGYEITAVAIGPNYQVLVWNRTFERIETYSEDGKFVRSFPISIPYTGNPSYDSLYVAKNGEVYACHAAIRDCTKAMMQLGAELRVYSLEGKSLRDIHDRMPTDSVANVDFIGGNKFSLGSVYEPSTGGRCITIQRDLKDAFSCLRAPQNRNLHHRFDAKGNLYFLLDNGVAKIQPDYTNAVILKDLPNYHSYDCEHKLDLSEMTMERLISLVYNSRVKNLEQENPELRNYLLKQKSADLRMLRNAVYARRSFKFKDSNVVNYFQSHFTDYKPITDNIDHLMLSDQREVNYLREIEEIVLGKGIDEAYGGAKKRPERHGASKREIIDLTNVKPVGGETWFRMNNFTMSLYFPPKYYEQMTGVNHIKVVYSPFAGYALLHTDNKGNDNKQGTNLWVMGFNKDTGFEFYTNKYAGQELDLDWLDEFAFSVKYVDSSTKKNKIDIYRRQNDKWYRPSEWKPLGN